MGLNTEKPLKNFFRQRQPPAFAFFLVPSDWGRCVCNKTASSNVKKELRI